MCVCVCVYLILKCSNQLRLSWGMDEEVALKGGGEREEEGEDPVRVCTCCASVSKREG